MTSTGRRSRVARCLALALAAGPVVMAAAPGARAEYGDVVLNRRAEREGERPVVFPHWFHRIRFRCNVCHTELGFRMGAGANDMRMRDIVDGRYCGACHDGAIAWNSERCDLCHSGRRGSPSGIVGGNETKGPGKW